MLNLRIRELQSHDIYREMAKGRGVEPRLQVLETRLLAGAPSNVVKI